MLPPSLAFDDVWLQTLKTVVNQGALIAPRGMQTLELTHHCVVVDTRKPVMTIPARKLSYSFMVAEAFWILTGDDQVAGIAPYNPNIAQFSDDGKTFFGAYGPKILDQLPYVVNKLLADPSTRQAGLTIWRESPPTTKDVPCTIAIFFSLRDDQLHTHVFMRSSDLWLGLPYDVFNFSMLTHLVCAKLNSVSPKVKPLGLELIRPGKLYLTAMSSHLYETNWQAANQCLLLGGGTEQPPTPELYWHNPTHLLMCLERLRHTKPGHQLRWWER